MRIIILLLILDFQIPLLDGYSIVNLQPRHLLEYVVVRDLVQLEIQILKLIQFLLLYIL